MVKLNYLISENDVNRKGTIEFLSIHEACLQVIGMYLDYMNSDEFIVIGSPDGSSIDVKVNLNNHPSLIDLSKLDGPLTTSEDGK